jgi:hypothetical protein
MQNLKSKIGSYFSDSQKVHIKSAIHTFTSTFVSIFGMILLQVPSETIMSPKTWTTSFIFGATITGVRAGIKALIPLK